MRTDSTVREVGTSLLERNFLIEIGKISGLELDFRPTFGRVGSAVNFVNSRHFSKAAACCQS